ncbi:MAG TPA: hypothetical protein PK737_03300 [Bacilli bacterium]|nr:hypothetical protein [Bacilli bacterium]
MKQYFHNNRVAGLLLAVICVSVIIILVFTLKYFYFGNGQTKYGDRLETIAKVNISATRQKEIIAKLKTNEQVATAGLKITGKIVYITLNFKPQITLIEAQSFALTTLDYFNKKEQTSYDFHFSLNQEATKDSPGFIIFGAKNIKGTNLVWNNNRIVDDSSTQEGKDETQ